MEVSCKMVKDGKVDALPPPSLPPPAAPLRGVGVENPGGEEGEFDVLPVPPPRTPPPVGLLGAVQLPPLRGVVVPPPLSAPLEGVVPLVPVLKGDTVPPNPPPAPLAIPGVEVAVPNRAEEGVGRTLLGERE